MDFNLATIAFAWCFITGATLVLVTRERHSRGAISLALALLTSGAVSSLGIWGWDDPEAYYATKKTLFLAEALLPFIWILYSANLAGRMSCRPSILTMFFLSAGLISLVSIVVIMHPTEMLFNPDYGKETVLFLGPVAFYFYLILTTYLIAALVTLERVFAGMERNSRWRLKFEVIGMGAIITIQMVFYSQGLMYRTLDFALSPARNIAVVVGVCLFLYTRFIRGYPEKLSVAPTLAYRSFILLATSTYLIFMGLVGEGLKYFGPSSNRLFALILALICGIVIFTICLSEQIRRKARVLIHKNFYQDRYDYREKWLEMTQRLGSKSDEVSLGFTMLEMYCQTFALKGGALYLRKTGQSDFMPVVSYAQDDIPEKISNDGALAAFLQRTHWVFNRHENLKELDGSDDRTLVEQFSVFIAVPMYSNNQMIGIIIFAEQINKDEILIYEDYDLMKTLASQCATTLHNLHLLDQLVESREMTAIGKVSTFVMHDLKNSVSNLALVIDNAKSHMNDPEFQQDMVETLSNSVIRMKNLIGKLKNFNNAPQLALEQCDLKRLALESLEETVCKGVNVKGEPIEVIIDKQEMSRVILNLVLNGLEATEEQGGEGEVEVETGVNGRIYLAVQDSGCGMSTEFIDNRLFKPFETTKDKGFGVGLYQCRQIVEAHGGELEVRSQPGEGSTFTVWLPASLKGRQV